jgi:hypothetical protein
VSGRLTPTRKNSAIQSKARTQRAAKRPAGPAAIAQRLQRRIGNQATQHLLQAKFGPVQRQAPQEKKLPKINYRRAQARNERAAKSLSWGTRLAEFKPDWMSLWNTGNFNAFADAVAAFQVTQKFNADGVLDSKTWDRIRPIGEVIAKQTVEWFDSKKVCTIAAKERLTKGYKRSTGEPLIPKEERKKVNYILQSFNLKSVDEVYRGTGAAGALVYLGKGTFVDQSDIWTKKALLPGAALQVWESKKRFEQLKKGDDIHPYGTAAVFVKYVGNEEVQVMHFDQPERWKKSKWAVWVGANLLGR